MSSYVTPWISDASLSLLTDHHSVYFYPISQTNSQTHFQLHPLKQSIQNDWKIHPQYSVKPDLRLCFFLSGLDSHNPFPQLFPRGIVNINEQNLATSQVCKSLLHEIDIMLVLLGTCWWLTLVKSRTLRGGKWG